MVLIITACNSLKKNITTVSSTATVKKDSITNAPSPMMLSVNGVFVPGNEELIAIKAIYADVTMDTLTEGYEIYTGVCTNCHESKGIYNRSEEKWKGIVDEMAVLAELTAVQKNAVYKYILSVKATQDK
ncbi:MAG: hypothetical protein ABIS12_08500 [Bacteroidia bacterium]